MIIWLSLGLIGWVLMMIRYILKELPKFSNPTLFAYFKGFVFSLILGPISIGFFGYIIWKLNHD